MLQTREEKLQHWHEIGLHGEELFAKLCFMVDCETWKLEDVFLTKNFIKSTINANLIPIQKQHRFRLTFDLVLPSTRKRHNAILAQHVEPLFHHIR